MLLVGKCSDFLLNRFICKFSVEHFFLLVYEFLHVLGTLLAWELYTGTSDVLCCVDVCTLFAKVII